MKKNRPRILIGVIVIVIMPVFLIYMLKPNYVEFETTEVKPEYGESIGLQIQGLERVHNSLDSLGLELVDTNFDSWENRLVKNKKTLLNSPYPIFPNFEDGDFFVFTTGLDSFDWGGIKYFVLPRYTRIVVLDIKDDFRIVYDEKFKQNIGKVFVEGNYLIFLYGSPESPSAGKLKFK